LTANGARSFVRQTLWDGCKIEVAPAEFASPEVELGCRMDQQLRCVFVANGQIHAQQVRAFLEAADIEVVERGESLRNTHGLTLNGLGAVEILVAEADISRARSLLEAAEAGTFRLAEDVENTSTDDGGVPPQDPNA
jgi:hypothetical protein